MILTSDPFKFFFILYAQIWKLFPSAAVIRLLMCVHLELQSAILKCLSEDCGSILHEWGVYKPLLHGFPLLRISECWMISYRQDWAVSRLNLTHSTQKTTPWNLTNTQMVEATLLEGTFLFCKDKLIELLSSSSCNIAEIDELCSLMMRTILKLLADTSSVLITFWAV